MPVNKGQTRQGTLKRKEDKWVAIFAGDEREAVITNLDKLPSHLQDGGQGEFYIEEASKRIGIRARFNKAL